MNTSPDHLLKQKLAIAKLLPERIRPNYPFVGRFWMIDESRIIKDTEWRQIVHDCIKKQSEEIQWIVFAKLAQIVSITTPAYLGTIEEYCDALELAEIIKI